MNTLYICAGNTCRSPMAQYYSQAAFAKANFRSRGLYRSGGTMSQKSLEALGRGEIDGQTHLSQTLQEENLARADWVIPMTRNTQGQLRDLYKDKISTFWDHGSSEIPNPYDGDGIIYQITYDLLRKDTHLMMETLEG